MALLLTAIDLGLGTYLPWLDGGFKSGFLAAGYASLLGCCLYLVLEILAAVAFFPIQSWIVGFGFEGWHSFFLYRYVVATTPDIGHPLTSRLIASGGLPAGLRHSALYQDAETIKSVARWIISPDQGLGPSSSPYLNWIDDEALARRLANILAWGLYLALSIYIWSRGAWRE